ncbi:sigma-70 family RNA polymerase sigma factor, partial [Microbacterium sp. CCNWLW41]|uniref:sigma-70 family RNA polymerase sigma factor n=2 Tax=unclassified Microbacterium TaxID=2609290 RepID=UPI0030105D4B
MEHDEVREHDAVDADVVADSDLVTRTRSGDSGAFGELWRRHYRAGVTVARNMTSSLDADDLVQEAYTRIYHSIVSGGGPTGSFRAYLFTSIRNTAAAWGRARRETAYDELDGVEDPAAGEHESEAALDRGLTHQAFRSLPTRWQEVLWYSEIEQMKPAEIAPLLGMKPTAVAQLTFRAREGLREAWIQAHLRSVADGSECQWTIERLGAYARRNLGRRDHAKVERHLSSCVRCSIVASEAREVSSRLALVLLPLAIGATGTAGYLATVQGGGTTLVAMAEMPSAVVEGAAAVLPRAADLAIGAGTSTGAGSGAAATTGGTLAGSTSAIASTGTGVGASAVAVTSSAGAVGSAVAAGTTTGIVAGAVGGSTLAGIGAASGLAAAGLVVVSSVVAAVALPAAAPDPAPTPAVTASEPGLLDALPGIVDEDEPALQLSDEPGPDPADISVIAEHGPSDDVVRGRRDTGGQGADGERPSRGDATDDEADGSAAEDGDEAGDEAGDAPDGPTKNGNGNAYGTGNGNAYGTGNGNAYGSGRGDEATTPGTPVQTPGRGNGGAAVSEEPAGDDDAAGVDEKKPSGAPNSSTRPGKTETAAPETPEAAAPTRPTAAGSPAEEKRAASPAADARGQDATGAEQAADARPGQAPGNRPAETSPTATRGSTPHSPAAAEPEERATPAAPAAEPGTPATPERPTPTATGRETPARETPAAPAA